MSIIIKLTQNEYVPLNTMPCTSVNIWNNFEKKYYDKMQSYTYVSHIGPHISHIPTGIKILSTQQYYSHNLIIIIMS